MKGFDHVGKTGPMERLAIERTSPRRKKEPLDHLTQDVLAAEAAGMSYGKWKALHPHTGSDPAPEPSTGRRIITCANCGKEIVVLTARVRKYCSEYCRKEYQQQKEKAKKEAEKNGNM